MQKLLESREKTVAKTFNSKYRYYPKFEDAANVIYPDELEIKDKIVSENSASGLDLYLKLCRPPKARLEAV